MDIYPIKHTQESKLRIEGDNGIIFNVIVPSSDENNMKINISRKTIERAIYILIIINLVIYGLTDSEVAIK